MRLRLIALFALCAPMGFLAGEAGAQQQNCPNGKCQVPQPAYDAYNGRPFPLSSRGFVNPIPGPLTVPQQMPPATRLDGTPVGKAPGENFEWKQLPGIGWGWVQVDAPDAVGGPLARLTRRVVCERIRTLAVDRAVASGTPRSEARKKVGRVTDEQILGGAVAMGAPVGALGDGAILRWLWDHRDAIVEWVLKILALFGDEEPKFGVLDLGGGEFALVAVAGERVFVFTA